ncbi:putative phosphoenolpyruvate synthase [Scyliorhinus canicula]|uniref:putative phosphoenolpyruvate synthase n=1 Tax=Scyliorhinus canicula TaxID=7830 RepID=UPI0018F6A058|nr:putative phosphoenolpyruvate synthase [Scyliorhinus canicula]
MISLFLLVSVFLCIYVVKNLLQEDPEPLNGRYSVPGRWNALKELFFVILYHINRRKNGTGTKNDVERENMGLGHNRAKEFGIGKDGTESREPGTFLGPSSKEMECVPNLLSHPQAINSNHFIGFTETDKTLFVLRLCRRPNGLCEIWLFLRVEGIGNFEHPVHPDAIVREESEKCWSGGGLKLECLEPYQRWRISFNGLLRKGPCRHEWSEEEGELIHVKFGFIWSAFTCVFDFETDIHPRALARGIAKEKWNRRFIENMNMCCQQLSHHEQWGQFVGKLEIEGYDRKELLLRGLRSHSSGIWKWTDIYRYSAFIVHFETGISVNLLCISFQTTITHMNTGYVMFPNGRKAGIDWSDASLADIADDGIVDDLYRISFTADGMRFNLTVRADKSACPVLYSGLGWESKTVACVANYQLNLTTQGWGLIQLYYRNESGRQIPDVIPTGKFQEPVAPECLKLVLALSEEMCQCAALVGSKGAQLAQLIEMRKLFGYQYSVPSGLCVTIAALKYQMKMNGSLQEVVAELNNVVCRRKKGNLQDVCKRCVELFRKTKLATEIENAIHNQLEELRLLGAEERLAVRSSAVWEDTEDTSAAGQLETKLGLKGFEQVYDAVKECWASLYSFQAVQYRHQRGQLVPSSMGVVIQQMVSAQAAGVLFTCDPLTGHPGRLIINANYGLGESVVSGNVMPDTITLSHSHKGPCQIIRKEMGTKKQQIKQAAEGGIVYEDILTLQAAQCCISEDIILRLGQVALQIQKAYGNPRDIEWAIKDTDIYLLQARPVTTLDIESEFELMHEFDSALCTDFVWMTTSNVSEMLPGAVTPLSMSTFIHAVDYALQEIMSKFGTAHHVFPCGSSFIITCCGHLFINLLTSYKVVESHLFTEKNEFDLSIRGSVLKEVTVEDAIFIHGRTSFWRKIINSMKVLKFLLTGERNARFLEKKLKIYQVPPANTAKLFYRNIDRELPEFYKGWITSITVSAKSTVWTNIVMHRFPKQQHMYTPEMMSDLAVLYSTCPDVLSADIPTYLEDIVELIKTQGKVNTFLEMDAQNAASWLLSQQSGAIGQKFQEFLEKHGYRCLREAELHEKSWASEPSKIIPAIQAALQRNTPIAKKIKMSSADSIASIKSPLSEIQKFILHLALPKARNAVATRELGKSMGIKMTDVFKRAYWKLANLMVQEGFLPDEDLLFFLTHSEIGKLLLHRSPALISRAQRRKRLLGKQMLLTFPEVNRGKPVPIDHRQSGTIGDREAGLTVTGMTVSQGIVEGTVRVVKTILEADCIQQGDILVVTNTDIGWSPYFPLLGGLVTEIGGLISHGAVVAREYGLPCIVSCAHATSLFRSGDVVILNAEKGFVQKVEETENASCG